MTKHFCDICGQEFSNYSDIKKYKLKKEELIFGESWWTSLEIHAEC